ncbi:MAG: YdcH family protein, partial [Gammaproteobacteria bacterium]
VLLAEDSNFQRLYSKHTDLNQQVDEASSGTGSVDDSTLEEMKKKKLLLKDQLAAMIDKYKRTEEKD